MKNSIIFLGFLFFTFCFSAQTENKDVTITATGSGSSQEFAKQTALRNAIEQAFGTFISSKTEILNDEIVADQMSSVSSGNVKSYEVLNESQLPNGTWASTLRVIVSVDKLTSFVEAKGITVEIKGGLFVLNIKQQILNEQGEINAIANMFGILHETMQVAFDYSVSAMTPQALDANNQRFSVPISVFVKPNQNFEFCFNYLMNNLSAICMQSQEVENYRNLNKPVYQLILDSARIKGQDAKAKTFFFRKETSLSIIKTFTNQFDFYLRNYRIDNSLNSCYSCGSSLSPIEIFNAGYYRDQGVWQTLTYEDDFIDFPRMEDTIVRFNYNDIFSLEEISNIDVYKIYPLGIRSKIKNGGFVVYEENGHGLVLSIADIALDFNENGTETYFDIVSSAIKNFEGFNFVGYNDWYIPNEEEIMLAYDKLIKPTIPLCLDPKSFNLESENENIKASCYRTSSSSNKKFLDVGLCGMHINESQEDHGVYNRHFYLLSTFNCGFLDSDYIGRKAKFQVSEIENSHEITKNYDQKPNCNPMIFNQGGLQEGLDQNKLLIRLVRSF
jgi:hypothetical protein